MKEVVACGILPFSYHDNDVYILCGKERYDPNLDFSDTYCSFGGFLEKDESYEECAARECYEESMGFLGSYLELQDKLNPNHPSYIGKLTFNKYLCYLINIPYDKNLTKTYRHVYNYVTESDCFSKKTEGMFEKSEMKWFRLRDLYDIIHHKKKKEREIFRKGFLEMIEALMKNRDIVFSLKQKCK